MILALEATDRGGSLGLARDGRMIELVYEESAVSHSERLMPSIQRILEKRDVGYKDLKCIAVARGPGSFTAIRLAVTTAKTLAMVCQAEIVAPTTLRVMAEYGRGHQDSIKTVLDARRGEIYYQAFRTRSDKLTKDCEPHLLDPDELVVTADDFVVFRGRELDQSDVFNKEGRVFSEASSRPLAAPLIDLATAKTVPEDTFEDPDLVSPCYIRRSDAQRSRDGNRGD